MNRLSPLHKGLITGVVMAGLSLLFFITKLPANSPLQFFAYAVYAAGIIWTLLSYARSAGYTGKFLDLFGQGFRCFIIVTLVMVAFTTIFSLSHPELKEEAATYFREELVKEKNKTPAEIDDMVVNMKKQYTTAVVSVTIFRYLIIGALFNAAASGGLLLMRRKA